MLDVFHIAVMHITPAANRAETQYNIFADRTALPISRVGSVGGLLVFLFIRVDDLTESNLQSPDSNTSDASSAERVKTAPVEGAANAVNSAVTDVALYCLNCAYDVRGLTSDSCPECGEAIDLKTLTITQIPWEHRKEIGLLRAFIKTTWQVAFKTDKFCREIARPTSYKDARLFQRLTVVFMFLAIVVVVVGGLMIENEWKDFVDDFGVTVTICLSASVAIGLLLWLFALTGLHTYLLHPKSVDVPRQNRAIAVGYYACGTLSLVPLGLLAAIVAIMFFVANEWFDWQVGRSTRNYVLVPCMIVCYLLVLLGLIGYWLTVLRMVVCFTKRGPAAWMCLAVAFPIVWLILAALLIGGVPMLYLYFGAMFEVIF